MKTPPFLLGATLLFWGWQADFMIPAVIMALILEGSRYIKLRWDLSDTDFGRIWHFCALLFLAAVVYAFAENGGPQGIGRFFENPNLASERDAALANAHTAASLIRWLPMIFILFVSAQAYSSAEKVPLHAISVILQWRRRQAKRRGQPLPATREVDVTYPYFAVCLLAAGVHPNENNIYFWGLSALLAWALWLLRPRRFGVIIWVSALALAILFGYSGAHGIGLLQRYVDSLDVQWIAQWLGRNRTDPSRSQTQIGQIGRIKTSTRIVIRLQPKSGQPPAYLREASYCTYHLSVWHADSGKNDFVGIYPAATNGDSWPLLPGKTNTARIGIACYLQGEDRDTHNPSGLLPLPSGSGRLENLPAYTLKENGLGAVRADGPGLIQFDALYGPGQTIDAAPETNPNPPALDPNFTNAPSATTEQALANQYNLKTNSAEAGVPPAVTAQPVDLQVPTNEAPALEEVVSHLALRGQSHEQALQTISEFFATNFTYRTWQDGDYQRNRRRTALGRFLLETHAGHCEYFATATVLLLREIGIPARYAVGYSVHEASWNGYVVRQRDAHAWCLVWNDRKKIWEDLDTTPGSWFEVESQHGALSAWLSDAWWWAHFQLAKLRWGQTRLREYILAGLVPILALLLFQIIRQRRRRNRGKDAGRPAIAWPGLDSEFYRIERQLAKRGVSRSADEALADWMERAATDPALLELRSPLRTLLRLHYRYRFDPQGLSDADREELRRKAAECLDQLSRLEPADVP